jgi:hypothetical protein
MPTGTETQALQNYRKELENAISIIDGAAANGGAITTVSDLDNAIDAIEKALDKDKYGELYNKLKIGYICQTRETTLDLLSGVTFDETVKKVEKDRNKIKSILRRVRFELEQTEENRGAKELKQISEMMTDVLENGKLFEPKSDMASAAIVEILKNKTPQEINAIKQYLQQPETLLNKQASKLAKTDSPDALRKQKTATEEKIRDLNQELEDKKESRDLKLSQNNSRLGNARNLREEEATQLRKANENIINTYTTETADIRKKIKEAGHLIEDINSAVAFKEGGRRYDSAIEVLSVIEFYSKKDSSPSTLNIINAVHKRIEDQRETVYGKPFLREVSNHLVGVFGQKLTTILNTLGKKDAQLKSIGPDKLGELAKCHDNKNSVKTWIRSLDSIEGQKDTKMTETVPRLITYLRSVIRNGNMSHINYASVNKAKNLANHLEAILHEHLMEQLKKDTPGYDSLSPIAKFNAFQRLLHSYSVREDEISKKIIRQSAGLGAAKNAALAVGGASTLAFAGLAAGGAALGLGAGALTSKYFSGRVKDEDLKKGLSRASKRSLLAAGIAATSAVFPPALFAAPLIFSPEIYKYRKQIWKGAKTGAGGLGTGAWWTTKKALKATKSTGFAWLGAVTLPMYLASALWSQKYYNFINRNVWTPSQTSKNPTPSLSQSQSPSQYPSYPPSFQPPVQPPLPPSQPTI